MPHDAVLYVNALRKHLRCDPSTKKLLLEQFHVSLNTYLDEHPAPTTSDLYVAFGDPEYMSRVLMEGISEKDIVRFNQQRALQRFCVIILIGIALTLMLYVFFWKSKPIKVVEGIDVVTVVTGTPDIQ